MKPYITKAFIFILGFTLSRCPLWLLRLSVNTLASTALCLLGERKDLAEKNIKGSFPSISRHEVAQLSYRSFKRTIEQGLLAFAWPHLNPKRIVKLFSINEKNKRLLSENQNPELGVLWMIPHFCHAETISLIPYYVPNLEVYALYRPLRNETFDRFVKRSRERFGVKTIDRKDGGMLKALRVLKRNKVLAMLFDQNAGGAGTRMKFLGRECSCTTLPDILHKKYKPKVLFVYTTRIGFWRSTIEVEQMSPLADNEMVIQKANSWLEGKLRYNRNLRESWLWMHQRWKPGSGKPKTSIND